MLEMNESEDATCPLPTGLPDDPLKSMEPTLMRTSLPTPLPLAERAQAMASARETMASIHSENETIQPAGPAGVGPAPNDLFSLSHVIGVGGCGEVWEAMQQSLGRRVAIKRIRTSEGGDTPVQSQQMLSQSFRQEALTTACLDHPNIVPVYDLRHDAAGQPMIAMKLVEGQPWDKMLKADRQELEFSERLSKHLPILIDMVQALTFAHSRGVIHRDIKPSQVMVGEFGEVLLMDWGLACTFKAGDEAGTAGLFAGSGGPVPMAEAANPAGTPAFMAPEQTQPTPENLGPWTDVFLVGATLYQLLTDEPPYRDKGSARAFRRAATRDCKPPEEAVGDDRRIPPELSRIAMKAMAREPWERHPSMRALLEELEQYVQGAGKRRESVDLVNAATEQLAKARGEYAALTAIIARLDQARALFPANPGIPPLMERARGEFADTALANGDLHLAEFHASCLAAGNRRKFLLAHIAQEKQRRTDHERRSRIFTVVSAVMIIITMVACLWGIDRHFKASDAMARTAKQLPANSAALRARPGDASLMLLSDESLASRSDSTASRRFVRDETVAAGREKQVAESRDGLATP